MGLNLKREFPRIRLFGDSESAFWHWSDWGSALMILHLNYETAEPFALTRIDIPDAKARMVGQSPKCVLISSVASPDHPDFAVEGFKLNSSSLRVERGDQAQGVSASNQII